MFASLEGVPVRLAGRRRRQKRQRGAEVARAPPEPSGGRPQWEVEVTGAQESDELVLAGMGGVVSRVKNGQDKSRTVPFSTFDLSVFVFIDKSGNETEAGESLSHPFLQDPIFNLDELVFISYLINPG